MAEPTDTDIINDIKRVASRLGLHPGAEFSRQEYRNNGGQFTHYQIYDGGRGWEGLCAAAGFITKQKVPVPDDVYFQKLAAAVQQLGRYPKASERKRFGLNFSKRRFPTLTIFVEKAIELGHVADLRSRVGESEATPTPVAPSPPLEPVGHAVPDYRPTPPIPAQTKRRKWERTGIKGFPYAPQDELSVVALFGILCANGTLDWEILEMNGGKGIDATCFDHATREEIRVEVKHIHSRGNWNHTLDEIDYIVCWENRWKDFPKPVIELRHLVKRDSRG